MRSLLVATILLAGCSANRDTQAEIAWLQTSCSAGDATACGKLPAAEEKGRKQASNKTLLLVGAPIIVPAALLLGMGGFWH